MILSIIMVSSEYWNSAFILAKLQNHSRAACSCCAVLLLYDRWSLCEASGNIIKSILASSNVMHLGRYQNCHIIRHKTQTKLWTSEADDYCAHFGWLDVLVWNAKYKILGCWLCCSQLLINCFFYWLTVNPRKILQQWILPDGKSLLVSDEGEQQYICQCL